MGASTSAAAAVTVSITSPEYSTKQKDKLSSLANAPGTFCSNAWNNFNFCVYTFNILQYIT